MQSKASVWRERSRERVVKKNSEVAGGKGPLMYSLPDHWKDFVFFLFSEVR